MRSAWLTIAAFALSGASAEGAILRCDPATGIIGGRAAVTIALQLEGEDEIAGTQNDLEFDPAVFSVEPTDCAINPAIGPDSPAGKNLSTSVLGTPPRVRNIVVALNNNNPIPSGALYTCNFAVSADVTPGTHTLVNARARSSDPLGQTVPVTAENCEVTLQQAPTPTATPECGDDDDCPDGRVCIDGECVDATPTVTPTPRGFCTDDEDCPPGQVCVNNRCVTVTPTPTPPGFCTDNVDCPAGQVCVDNRCVTPTPTATHRRGGGGGCSCDIDPAARQHSWAAALALAVPPLILFGLRRRATAR
ncbi:MAG: EB domain-containing protein [Candidatus Binatia bacterium]